MADQNGPRDYKPLRNSAIEVSLEDARKLTTGTSISIVDEYTQHHSKEFNRLSYIPPERILGVLEFDSFEQYSKFRDALNDLTSDYWNGLHQGEQGAINHFVEQALDKGKLISRFRKWVKQIRNRDEQDLSSPAIEKLDKRQLLFLLGAMITRHMLVQHSTRITNALSDNEHDQSTEWKKGQILRLKTLNPTFASTKQLQANLIQKLSHNVLQNQPPS